MPILKAGIRHIEEKLKIKKFDQSEQKEAKFLYPHW